MVWNIKKNTWFCPKFTPVNVSWRSRRGSFDLRTLTAWLRRVELVLYLSLKSHFFFIFYHTETIITEHIYTSKWSILLCFPASVKCSESFTCLQRENLLPQYRKIKSSSVTVDLGFQKHLPHSRDLWPLTSLHVTMLNWSLFRSTDNHCESLWIKRQINWLNWWKT